MASRAGHCEVAKFLLQNAAQVDAAAKVGALAAYTATACRCGEELVLSICLPCPPLSFICLTLTLCPLSLVMYLPFSFFFSHFLASLWDHNMFLSSRCLCSCAWNCTTLLLMKRKCAKGLSPLLLLLLFPLSLPLSLRVACCRMTRPPCTVPPAWATRSWSTSCWSTRPIPTRPPRPATPHCTSRRGRDTP